MSYYGNNQYGDFYGSMGGVGAMGNMGNIAGDMSGGDSNIIQEPLSTGVLAAFGVSGYPNEPSLLEELGVNFGHIWQKTRAVLYPFGRGAIDDELMQDSDLAGPILFFLLFGTFLLLSGKSNFGYIYGLGLLGTLIQYSVLNGMAQRSIGVLKTMSVLGYCMLPLASTAAVGIFAPLKNVLGYTLGTFVVLWCATSASAIFVAYLHLHEVRVLVAYPLVLFYGVFSLLTLF